MELGWITVWGGDVEEFKSQIRDIEALGIGAVTIGDSPVAWNEMYVSLTMAVYETTSAIISPMVAMPFLRHPAVHARAMSSLAELSGGRAVLTLGTGATGAYGTGNRPLTQAEMREYFRALRALLRGEEVTWQGSTLMALKAPREVPLYYSGWGPKALTLAGEVADGVVVKIGSSLDAVADKLRIVRLAAERAGRDPETIDVWAYSYVAFGGTKDEAMESIASLLASSASYDYRAKHARESIPVELRGAMTELQQRYDVSQHIVAGGPNGKLVRELGLEDFLAGRAAVAGTSAEVGRYLDDLEGLGVRRFLSVAPDNASPREAMGRLADVARQSSSAH
jgi:alkanesulfonate monooxygenase SsuD/methylene tetrahydromethanopterin reductase-like flavin-dependent oxidoreductase (luciferase family)